MTQSVQDPAVVSLPKEALTWGTFCHFAGLLVLAVPSMGNVLGPLLLWLLKKDDHPFIDEQGKESLNFQISMTIYALLAAITVIGLPIAAIIFVADVALTIVASIRTSNAEPYRYPLTLRLVR